jgi:hypothetical protein
MLIVKGEKRNGIHPIGGKSSFFGVFLAFFAL